MRCSVAGLLGLFAAAQIALAANSSAGPLQGIYNLVQRRIPEHVDDFTFKLERGSGDEFEVSDTEQTGGITVTCTTVSACSRGLYTYVISLAIARRAKD